MPFKDLFTVNPDLEKTFLKTLVRPYENLNFIKRLMRPQEYGMLPMGPKSGGSHLMSYATDDKGAIAYPQIIQRAEGHPLEMLSAADAIDYAIKNKEYIPFSNAGDAEYFGKNYKKIGGMY